MAGGAASFLTPVPRGRVADFLGFLCEPVWGGVLEEGVGTTPVVLTDGQSGTGLFCGGAKASDAANWLPGKDADWTGLQWTGPMVLGMGHPLDHAGIVHWDPDWVGC